MVKIGLLFHIAMGLFMFTSNDLFPKSDPGTDPEPSDFQEPDTVMGLFWVASLPTSVRERFFQREHSVVYLKFVAIFLIYYAIRSVVVLAIWFCPRKSEDLDIDRSE